MFWLVFYFFIVFVMLTGAMAGKQRNILFIMVDDLRPALGCYGDAKAFTPHIDAFAKQSFIFTHAYSQQALCAPSRNSMLTSRRPDTLRLYDFYSYWRHTVGNFTTLPQYLKSNGYETVSMGKIFHFGISSNFTDDYPYSWSSVPFHSASEQFMNKPVCRDDTSGKLEKNVICPVWLPFQPFETLPDIDSVKKAKEFIMYHADEASTRKPYFLAVGFHKPHIPLRFPAEYLEFHELEKFHEPPFNYVPHDLPAVAFNPYTDIRSRHDAKQWNISFPFGPMPHPFGVRLRQAYYAAVTYVDDLVGELLATVNLNETVVVLTSDHGWSLGEHAEWAKYSNFDVALRVPLIIHDPDIEANGAQIADIVELVDIFPTIVELANVQPVPSCSMNRSDEVTCAEGRSLVPLFARNFSFLSAAFSQYPRPADYPIETSDRPALKLIKIMGYSIRTTLFRYTVWIKFDNQHFQRDWSTVFGEELYDHRIDSSENINLITRKELDPIRKRLRNRLQRQFP